MIQWLRALAAFSKDPSSVPSAQVSGGRQLSGTQVTENQMPSSGLCGH